MEEKEKPNKAKPIKKATNKKTTTKKTPKPNSASVKKVVKKKAPVKEEKISKENTSAESKKAQVKEKDFWNDAKENINEGAKIISEEVKHFGKRLSAYSEVLFGKVKDNTSEVIKYGLDLTNDGVHRAQEVAENLKDDFEIRKLNTKKKEVSTQLGMKFYLAVKKNTNEVPADFIKDKEILSLLKELEEIDKEILNHSETKK